MSIRHIILALAASFSFGAYAATDATSVPMSDMKSEHAGAPAKTMKPHSHMEEKTGIPAKPARPAGPAPSKSRHIHSRDAK